MPYHNSALDLPEPPTDAPLILRMPANAANNADAAMFELLDQTRRIGGLLEQHYHNEARRYLASLPKLGVALNYALQILEHGDLNVDELVLREIPDTGWVSVTDIHNRLGSYDHRLTSGLYRPHYDWLSGMTPIDAVIERLTDEGRLKKHGSGQRVRRLRKGEKPTD